MFAIEEEYIVKKSSGKKYIENYDNKILMRSQFILQVYVYRRR